MSGKRKKDFPGRSLRSHCSNFHGKETPFAMWKALTNLFQNTSDRKKLAQKEKIRKIKMEKGDLYFEVPDQVHSMS